MVRALCILTFSYKTFVHRVCTVYAWNKVYVSLIISRCSLIQSVSFCFFFLHIFFAACLPLTICPRLFLQWTGWYVKWLSISLLWFFVFMLRLYWYKSIENSNSHFFFSLPLSFSLSLYLFLAKVYSVHRFVYKTTNISLIFFFLLMFVLHWLLYKCVCNAM